MPEQDLSPISTVTTFHYVASLAGSDVGRRVHRLQDDNNDIGMDTKICSEDLDDELSGDNEEGDRKDFEISLR